MSRWRRIALEELPWCKKAIETAKTPFEMWIALREKFESVLEASPPQREQAQRIMAFAVRCSGSGFLDPWAFFDTVLGMFILGNSALREHLPHLMPERDFERWIEGIADTPEEISESRRAFYAGRRAKQ